MSIATTGIAGLDAQLGGGIPRGTTLLLLSEPSNALALFSEQFGGGGLDAGEDVHFFEFDRTPRAVRDSVMGFVAPGNVQRAKISIYDGYSTQFGRGAAPGTPDPSAPQPIQPAYAMPFILSTLQAQAAAKPYRLVVESLSALTKPENEKEVLEFVRQMTWLGQEMGGLHMISVVKGMHSPSFEMHLKHLVGGVLEVGVERKGFGLYNYLIVSKLLNVTDPIRILLWKETEKGLWLESTKRVF